jgi:hypothetical protein
MNECDKKGRSLEGSSNRSNVGVDRSRLEVGWAVGSEGLPVLLENRQEICQERKEIRQLTSSCERGVLEKVELDCKANISVVDLLLLTHLGSWTVASISVLIRPRWTT